MPHLDAKDTRPAAVPDGPLFSSSRFAGFRLLDPPLIGVLFVLFLASSIGVQAQEEVRLEQVVLRGTFLAGEERRPSRVLVAGEPVAFQLEVTALAPFPRAGESLRVTLPHYHARRGFTPPQGTDPAGAGFTRILSSPAGVSLRFLEPDLSALVWDSPLFFDILFVRPLQPGEEVRLEYGASNHGSVSARVQELAVDSSAPEAKGFRLTRRDPEGRRIEDLAHFLPDVVSGPAERLRVLAPATPSRGRPFEVRVVALDRHGNVVPDHRGPIVLEGSPGVRAPRGADFRESDRGVLVLGGAVLTEDGGEGPWTLEVHDPTRPDLRGESAPIVPRPPAERDLLFADPHVHTGSGSGDAVGSVEQALFHGRQAAGLDVVAVTDHDHDMTLATWLDAVVRTRQAYRPGRFVPFLGFEWTPAFSHGHRTVLFPEDQGIVVDHATRQGDTPEELWQQVRPFDGLTLPHFPSAGFFEHHRIDWSHHDPEREPLCEVYSQWVPYKKALMGQDPETNPEGYQKALVLGYRMGVFGGSDSHVGLPGERGGITGVYANGRTRAAVWEAFHARRTFATTGERIILSFHVQGATMGSEVTTPTTSVRVQAAVHGTGPLEVLEVLRGRKGDSVPLPVVHRAEMKGRRSGRLDWVDRSPPGGTTFYYLRALQADGARAWSSPVWVETIAPEGAGQKRPNVVLLKEQGRRPGRELPLAPWTARSFLSGSRDEIDLREDEDEDEDEGLRITWRSRETLGGSFFMQTLARQLVSAPFELEEGGRYQIRYEARSVLPGSLVLVMVDRAGHRPAGLFRPVPLPGARWPVEGTIAYSAPLSTREAVLVAGLLGPSNTLTLSKLTVLEESR